MTYGIQAWGNSTSITKLGVLQKRVIRLINKKDIEVIPTPNLGSEGILKISDYKLHVSLFMFDLQNGSLPISFKTYRPLYRNHKLLPTILYAPDNMVF